MSGWLTYYLKAADLETAKAALGVYGLVGADGEWQSYNRDCSLALDPDVDVWTRLPEYDDAGAIVDPGEREPGWFGNLRSRQPLSIGQTESLAAGGIELRDPATPSRRFF